MRFILRSLPSPAGSMVKRHLKLWVSSLLWIVCMNAYAANDVILISGKVSYAGTGRPIPGARVVLLHGSAAHGLNEPEFHESASTISMANGSYVMQVTRPDNGILQLVGKTCERGPKRVVISRSDLASKFSLVIDLETHVDVLCLPGGNK